MASGMRVRSQTVGDADVSAENIVHGTQHETMSRRLALLTNSWGRDCIPETKLEKDRTLHTRVENG